VPRKRVVVLLLVVVLLIVAAVTQSDRLYEWLLAMHGVRPNH
jgi:hypothetical protein